MITTYEELENTLREIMLSTKPNDIDVVFRARTDNGHTEEEIREMEEIMGTPLFKDYREFVKHYRSFAVQGDSYVEYNLKNTAEMTVIHHDNSKELDLDFPQDCYCIGSFETDLPIFIQSSVTGFVYSCNAHGPKGTMKKIADNFWEFMNAEVEYWRNFAAEQNAQGH